MTKPSAGTCQDFVMKQLVPMQISVVPWQLLSFFVSYAINLWDTLHAKIGRAHAGEVGDFPSALGPLHTLDTCKRCSFKRP